MTNKRIRFIGLSLILVLGCFLFLINFQFKRVQQIPFSENSSKEWSHRGYAKTKDRENTLTAITLALENDYRGVEIDIWFKEGRFYVSHEESYSDSLPKLEDIFLAFPKTYFWLDLKNLSYSNYSAIANRLEQLEKEKQTYLIESKNGLSLGLLNQKGFFTTYWVMNDNVVRQFIKKCWIVYFEFNGISMSAKDYQKENIRKKYRHLNIHLWGKQPNLFIYDWNEVKIILDDREL